MSMPPPKDGLTRLGGRGHLLGNTILFGRLLRFLGLEVTPGHIIDIVTSADFGLIRHKEDFRSACRALLVKHPDQRGLFELAFDLFWVKYRDKPLDALTLGQLLRQVQQQQEEETEVLLSDPESGNDVENREGGKAEIVVTYSTYEAFRQKDFSRMNEDELEQVFQLMNAFHWDLTRQTRRYRVQNRGRQVDPRKSMRHNLKYGGEPLHRIMRSPSQKPRALVTLCDISGSMERYARILIQFVYALSHRLQRCEAFVFSTDLSRITRQLQFRSVHDALQRSGREVHNWGAGTRIGESLRQFNFHWARRVLGEGAVVMIISDGWDRGEIPLLQREMARLQRSCHHLIWLNPLLGSPDYEPLAQGIRAALPFVDDFRPIHNLVSLEQLGNSLAQLH